MLSAVSSYRDTAVIVEPLTVPEKLKPQSKLHAVVSIVGHLTSHPKHAHGWRTSPEWAMDKLM